SRRRQTISKRDWSSDVCSSDLAPGGQRAFPGAAIGGRGGDRAGPESRPQGRKGRRADGKEERKHRRAGIFILRRLCLFGRTGRGLHDLSAAVVLLVNPLIFLLSYLPIN